MNDQEFRDHFKPIQVPASYAEAGTLQEKVVFALAAVGEGPIEAVVKKLEELDPDADSKEVIGVTHRVLSEQDRVPIF